MSKEKIPDSSIQDNYSGEELTDNTHLSTPDASMLEKIKKTYLPESKTDNRPSEESIESANGLEHPKPVKPGSLI